MQTTDSSEVRPSDATNDHSSGTTNKKHDICQIKITNIYFSSAESGEVFNVLLVPSKQGLYDLIDAVFHHSLTDLTGWTIDSHLWTVKYGRRTFSNGCSEMLQRYDEENDWLEINSKERRIIDSTETNDYVPFSKGTKGSFSMDQGALKFNFVIDDIKVDEIDDVISDDMDKNEAVTLLYPRCISLPTSEITYTANTGAEFASDEDRSAINELRNQYIEFYKGENGWKRFYDTRDYNPNSEDPENFENDWSPAKPLIPEWSIDERSIIGLFMNAGWKFTKAWNSGMMFAFPHRTKSATQYKWYQLQKKRYYQIERKGEGMTNPEKIIHVKKMCKKIMDEMIEQGPPVFKKPQNRKRTWETLPDYRRGHVYLPKRLRGSSYIGEEDV